MGGIRFLLSMRDQHKTTALVAPLSGKDDALEI